MKVCWPQYSTHLVCYSFNKQERTVVQKYYWGRPLSYKLIKIAQRLPSTGSVESVVSRGFVLRLWCPRDYVRVHRTTPGFSKVAGILVGILSTAVQQRIPGLHLACAIDTLYAGVKSTDSLMAGCLICATKTSSRTPLATRIPLRFMLRNFSKWFTVTFLQTRLVIRRKQRKRSAWYSFRFSIIITILEYV